MISQMSWVHTGTIHSTPLPRSFPRGKKLACEIIRSGSSLVAAGAVSRGGNAKRPQRRRARRNGCFRTLEKTCSLRFYQCRKIVSKEVTHLHIAAVTTKTSGYPSGIHECKMKQGSIVMKKTKQVSNSMHAYGYYFVY